MERKKYYDFHDRFSYEMYLDEVTEPLMDEKKAREILGDTIEPAGELVNFSNYTSWKPGEIDITLDGLFSAEELEAIAWWMKNIKKEGEENGKETST